LVAECFVIRKSIIVKFYADIKSMNVGISKFINVIFNIIKACIEFNH